MKFLGYKFQLRRPIDRILNSSRVKETRNWLIERARMGRRQLLEVINHRLTRIRTERAYEVRPSHDGWMITRAGSSLPIRVYAKKPEAIREAKRLARAKKTHVDIFTRQGTLQMRQSFA